MVVVGLCDGLKVLQHDLNAIPPRMRDTYRGAGGGESTQGSGTDEH